ncbi:hypothetical protein KIPB_000622, partial [Kipferlia bialata]
TIVGFNKCETVKGKLEVTERVFDVQEFKSFDVLTATSQDYPFPLDDRVHFVLNIVKHQKDGLGARQSRPLAIGCPARADHVGALVLFYQYVLSASALGSINHLHTVLGSARQCIGAPVYETSHEEEIQSRDLTLLWAQHPRSYIGVIQPIIMSLIREKWPDKIGTVTPLEIATLLCVPHYILHVAALLIVACLGPYPPEVLSDRFTRANQSPTASPVAGSGSPGRSSVSHKASPWKLRRRDSDELGDSLHISKALYHICRCLRPQPIFSAPANWTSSDPVLEVVSARSHTANALMAFTERHNRSQSDNPYPTSGHSHLLIVNLTAIANIHLPHMDGGAVLAPSKGVSRMPTLWPPMVCASAYSSISPRVALTHIPSLHAVRAQLPSLLASFPLKLPELLQTARESLCSLFSALLARATVSTAVAKAYEREGAAQTPVKLNVTPASIHGRVRLIVKDLGAEDGTEIDILTSEIIKIAMCPPRTANMHSPCMETYTYSPEDTLVRFIRPNGTYSSVTPASFRLSPVFQGLDTPAALWGSAGLAEAFDCSILGHVIAAIYGIRQAPPTVVPPVLQDMLKGIQMSLVVIPSAPTEQEVYASDSPLCPVVHFLSRGKGPSGLVRVTEVWVRLSLSTTDSMLLVEVCGVDVPTRSILKDSFWHVDTSNTSSLDLAHRTLTQLFTGAVLRVLLDAKALTHRQSVALKLVAFRMRMTSSGTYQGNPRYVEERERERAKERHLAREGGGDMGAGVPQSTVSPRTAYGKSSMTYRERERRERKEREENEDDHMFPLELLDEHNVFISPTSIEHVSSVRHTGQCLPPRCYTSSLPPLSGQYFSVLPSLFPEAVVIPHVSFQPVIPPCRARGRESSLPSLEGAYNGETQSELVLDLAYVPPLFRETLLSFLLTYLPPWVSAFKRGMLAQIERLAPAIEHGSPAAMALYARLLRVTFNQIHRVIISGREAERDGKRESKDRDPICVAPDDSTLVLCIINVSAAGTISLRTPTPLVGASTFQECARAVLSSALVSELAGSHQMDAFCRLSMYPVRDAILATCHALRLSEKIRLAALANVAAAMHTVSALGSINLSVSPSVLKDRLAIKRLIECANGLIGTPGTLRRSRERENASSKGSHEYDTLYPLLLARSVTLLFSTMAGAVLRDWDQVDPREDMDMLSDSESDPEPTPRQARLLGRIPSGASPSSGAAEGDDSQSGSSRSRSSSDDREFGWETGGEAESETETDTDSESSGEMAARQRQHDKEMHRGVFVIFEDQAALQSRVPPTLSLDIERSVVLPAFTLNGTPTVPAVHLHMSYTNRRLLCPRPGASVGTGVASPRRRNRLGNMSGSDDDRPARGTLSRSNSLLMAAEKTNMPAQKYKCMIVKGDSGDVPASLVIQVPDVGTLEHLVTQSPILLPLRLQLLRQWLYQCQSGLSNMCSRRVCCYTIPGTLCCTVDTVPQYLLQCMSLGREASAVIDKLFDRSTSLARQVCVFDSVLFVGGATHRELPEFVRHVQGVPVIEVPTPSEDQSEEERDRQREALDEAALSSHIPMSIIPAPRTEDNLLFDGSPPVDKREMEREREREMQAQLSEALKEPRISRSNTESGESGETDEGESEGESDSDLLPAGESTLLSGVQGMSGIAGAIPSFSTPGTHLTGGSGDSVSSSAPGDRPSLSLSRGTAKTPWRGTMAVISLDPPVWEHLIGVYKDRVFEALNRYGEDVRPGERSIVTPLLRLVPELEKETERAIVMACLLAWKLISIAHGPMSLEEALAME